MPPSLRLSLSFAASLPGLLLHAPASARAQPPVAASPQPAPSPDSLLAIVADPAATPAARDRAADQLIDAAHRREGLDALRVHLSTAGPSSPTILPLFRAAARTSSPPPGLFETFTSVISRAGPDQLPALIPALSSWRTRESLRVLVACADPGQPPAVREAAFQALARLTGREDIGADFDRWGAFADSAADLTEDEWTRGLLAATAARADALAAREAAAIARVTDTLRRLYLATPPEQRSAFLASLLLEESDQARALGFELVSRELSSTHRLDQPVSDACLRLLLHPSPRVRQNAALLLFQLSPPDAGVAIAAALARETEPDPAAALLSASARWPSLEIIPHVVRWLSHPTARASASQAAIALVRAGLLYEPQPREQILRIIRAIPEAELPPAAGPLLVLLGDDDDRRASARLLFSASPALRIATADAAVLFPELLPDMLRAAAADAQLWDITVRAVAMHRATATGFIALTALPAPLPDARREGLLFVASVMPAVEILAAADLLAAEDPTRELLLTPLLDPMRRMSLSPEAPSYEATVRGLLMLARARLAGGRADEALLALDATPDPLDPADAAQLLRLRTLTLLTLNRGDEAAAMDATADDWLDALETLSQEPIAEGLIEIFEEKFRSLTPSQQARADAIRNLAAAADQARRSAEPPPS